MDDIEKIKKYITEKKAVSIPELQKKFIMDYPQAKRIINSLMDSGFIEYGSGITYRYKGDRKQDCRIEFDKINEHLSNLIEERRKHPHIKIIGAGAAGIAVLNTLNKMIGNQAELFAVDADEESLTRCECENKLLMKGDILADSMILEEIVESADMVIVTAGIGGQTGSRIATDIMGITDLEQTTTVAFVNEPYEFEGIQRIKNAKSVLSVMEAHNAVIFNIPSDNIKTVLGNCAPMSLVMDTLNTALAQGIMGLVDYALTPRKTIGIDDIIWGKGVAYFGTGTASDKDYIGQAVKEALNSSLPSVTSQSANDIILLIEGDENLNLINESVCLIKDELGNSVNIYVGVKTNPSFGKELKFTVYAIFNHRFE